MLLAKCWQRACSWDAKTRWVIWVLRAMVEDHGVPLSLYRDRHSAFQRNDDHWSEEEQMAGRQNLTHLGRALELGIEQIAALTPQAKGRIERLWKTFQDRLRSQLRLAKAKTMEQANAVLARFLPEYNRKFAKAAKETGNDFRKPDQRVNRHRLFRLRYKRTVGHDHTISFGAHRIQLPPVAGANGYAGQKLEVSHQLNGERHVWLGDRRLYQGPAPVEYTVGMAPQSTSHTTQAGREEKGPEDLRPWWSRRTGSTVMGFHPAPQAARGGAPTESSWLWFCVLEGFVTSSR